MPAGRLILKPGKNCWRIAPAKRAAVLIDAAHSYTQLEKVLRRAQKSILIVGWDFDAGIRLLPEDPGSPKLGDFLRSLVGRHSHDYYGHSAPPAPDTPKCVTPQERRCGGSSVAVWLRTWGRGGFRTRSLRWSA